MKNTDFLNLELPEREDKINVGVLTSDFEIIEDIIKQHAVVETMELDGVGAITGAIGPYIRLQNISEQQVTVDIGNETIVLESGENKIIRETAQNIGVITSGNVHITYFTNAKTYTDRNFYDKKKVDDLLKNVKTTVDAELSDVSENPVQNKAITQELANYATTSEVESKVTEKVAEIVAGAPEDFDTLKEMSDWLTEHEDSAAAMNTAIQKNASDIETANTNIQKNVDDISIANAQITDIYNRCGGGKNLYNIADKTTTAGAFIINDKPVSFPCDSIIVSFDFVGTRGVNTFRLLDASGNIINSNATDPKSGTRGSAILESAKKAAKIRWWADGYGTFSNIMIRPAYIEDDTYVPYIPTIQELIARIEALEGATATTEGGE